MQIARDRIAAPDDDELGFGEEFHLHAHFAAQRMRECLRPSGRANRAIELRCAQLVEKTRCHTLALRQTHRAGIAVRQDGLWVNRSD